MLYGETMQTYVGKLTVNSLYLYEKCEISCVYTKQYLVASFIYLICFSCKECL